MQMLRKNSTAKTTTLEYVMSDQTVDRFGDVIEARGWDLREFALNSVALVNHNADFICGRWMNVRVVGNQLRGHLELAPEGISKRIDEVRKLVLNGYMPGASVGFLPVRSKPRPGGGVTYQEQRLVECSVVATPANSNALLQRVKSLGISNQTIETIFKSPPPNGTLAERQAAARAALARAKERQQAALRIPQLPSEYSDWDELSPEEIAALELVRIEEQKARIASQFAHNKSTAFDDSSPSITFNGQLMYRLKNEFGW